MIYLDRNASEYFDLSYFDVGVFDLAKDAYKRVMGSKLDDEHMRILASHRSILYIRREASDPPGWWNIIQSYS